MEEPGAAGALRTAEAALEAAGALHMAEAALEAAGALRTAAAAPEVAGALHTVEAGTAASEIRFSPELVFGSQLGVILLDSTSSSATLEGGSILHSSVT